MSRIQRAFTALIILATLIGSIRTAQAVTIDPYQNKSLRVAVFFEYEKNSTQNGTSNFESSNTSFTQQYTLDALGYIISRWIVTYDVGLHYSKQTISSNGNSTNKNTTQQWFTYFSTTLLPKSNIPLTMYINDTRNTTFTQTTDDRTQTKLNYGLAWKGLFRTLPRVNFLVDKNRNISSNSKNMSTDYTLDLKKKYGATDNRWDNNYFTSENKIEGTKTNQISTNFKNLTEISRSTHLTVDLAASKAELENGESSSVIGMGSNISSSPNKEFTQNHNYSFLRLSQDGEFATTEEQHTYSGDMTYRISEKILSTAAVSVRVGFNDSPTLSRDEENLDTSGSISYRITEHLSASENISYNRFTSTSQNTLNTNLDDRTTLNINTAVNYSNQYSWTNLNASGSAGYVDTKSENVSIGRGFTTSANTGLSGINVVPWVILNTSGHASQTQISTSQSSDNSIGFNFSATNSIIKKLVTLSASYAFDKSESSILPSNTSSTIINYNASSNYFPSLPVNLSQFESTLTDTFNGTSTVLTRMFNISHIRTLLRGNLTASFSYSTLDGNFREGTNHHSILRFNSRYRKSLTRNSTWDLAAIWLDDDANETNTKTLTVENNLVYQLRSWLIQLKHDYTRETLFNVTSIENIYLVSASRSFGITWR